MTHDQQSREVADDVMRTGGTSAELNEGAAVPHSVAPPPRNRDCAFANDWRGGE